MKLHYIFTIFFLTFLFQPCLNSTSAQSTEHTKHQIDSLQSMEPTLNPIHDFIDSFNGKSEQQIVKELGEPTKRDTWDFNETKQTLMIYNISNQKQRQLSLYFSTIGSISKVVHVSLNISSH
jgi:hypothetical protein